MNFLVEVYNFTLYNYANEDIDKSVISRGNFFISSDKFMEKTDLNILIEPKLDSGPLLMSSKIDISKETNCYELSKKLSVLLFSFTKYFSVENCPPSRHI